MTIPSGSTNQSPTFLSQPESETCRSITFKNSSQDNDTDTDTDTDRKPPGLMERRRHNASSNDDTSDESYVYSENKPKWVYHTDNHDSSIEDSDYHNDDSDCKSEDQHHYFSTSTNIIPSTID